MIRFDTNNYEFNKSSDIGIYIIHGFSNTTYEVKELAEFLGNQGFHTIANNLPGHGTTPKECNRVRYQMWLEHVTQDLANLISVSKKTYVIGCSMGADLALYLSSIFPINGCVVGGTVLKFKNPLTIHLLIPLLCKIIKFSKKEIKNNTTTKYYGYTSYVFGEVEYNEYGDVLYLSQDRDLNDESNEPTETISTVVNSEGRVIQSSKDSDGDGTADEMKLYSYNENGLKERIEIDSDADLLIDTVMNGSINSFFFSINKIFSTSSNLNIHL